ncbi:(deoxy)nucleoside triphosphate pyrophosphohydrolase [Chlorobaculum sp. 24CR]|uniref:(deoxy)nucleoside triphosphate pyrophosphohydrolase n=1 Tax=Chlorobaculum sp. 24CR TaxID=2508878 RepID=UPI00100A6107|nr:(deoxy)nucleoside triphosphate pyrophosphohydrolase [Chlorobaculum sp. 24CR]RXK84987.1 (deoxy)nucleoside triphosphate pyrophosphohydrolase [Chlorobaculum sp. 24CR]
MYIGDVVCAIIERDGRFLIARRPAGKHLARKWEFPGGKVEAGESEAEALDRELLEELGVRVEILDRLTPVEHSYSDRSLRLIAFRCRIAAGVPDAGEHEELRWIEIGEADAFDFPEADLPILVEYRQKIAASSAPSPGKS